MLFQCRQDRLLCSYMTKRALVQFHSGEILCFGLTTVVPVALNEVAHRQLRPCDFG